MKWLLFFPFILQAVCIVFDEGYFHLKRGLPRFECIGHPLDTLTVIACLAFSLILPFSQVTFMGFIFLALFSCFFVTKDEFVHLKHCEAKEMWLHALLFINHPILLSSLIILWLHEQHVISWFELDTRFISQFIMMQTVFASAFFLYQVIYWNFIRKPLETLNENDQ
jgi:hypothetical protein